MRHLVDRVPQQPARIAEAVRGRVAAGTAPSSAWALFRDTELLATDGAGDVTGGTGEAHPPTADTAFRIASVTKSVTAAATLLARDRGLLRLDDPAVPDLPLPQGVPSPTVAQLLAMDGGLPTDDPWADRQESLPEQDFRALLAGGLRFARRPGSGFEYSNTGFAMVGLAVGDAVGRPFRAFVVEELLTPWELTGLGFDADLPGVTEVADGFHRVDDAWQRQPHSAPGAYSPIGGLFASPRGLARWAGLLAAAHREDPATPAVLSAASRVELQQPRTPVPDGGAARHYGYGLVVEEHPRHGRIVSHSGGYPGFGAHVRWHPATGLGLLVLENARYSAAVATVTAELEALLDAIAVTTVPQLWPETVAARDVVERLLRDWDDDVARDLLADNVSQDTSLPRRQDQLRRLADAVGLREVAAPPLADASPASSSPATLSWTSPGTSGALRCTVQLTPQARPRVQTLRVHQV